MLALKRIRVGRRLTSPGSRAAINNKKGEKKNNQPELHKWLHQTGSLGKASLRYDSGTDVSLRQLQYLSPTR